MTISNLSEKKEKIKSLYDLCNLSLETLLEDINDESNQNELTERFDKFFFELESCASECYSLNDSEHHELGKWFADTAHDALQQLVAYHRVFKNLGSNNYYSPSENSLSSMQALIKLYLDKSKVKTLNKLLVENEITTAGFDEKRPFRMTKQHERIISIVVAVVSVVLMVALIYKMDEPTPLKYNFYCVLIATLSAFSAALFTGTLDLKIKNIQATCGFGAFIIVLFVLQGVKVF